MSLDDEERWFFQQLQQMINLPTHWLLNFSPTDDGFLKRLDMLEDAEGKLAFKEGYSYLRDIIKSGDIREKRKFIIDRFPPNTPDLVVWKRYFDNVSDKLIHVAFRMFALASLAKTRFERIQSAAAAADATARFHAQKKVKSKDEMLRELEEYNVARAQAFSSGISEIAKALEAEPDSNDLWGKLAVYLDNARKDYLAKAAQSVVFRNQEVHIRTKRELAKLLIEHGAPTAAEIVLDGATLDPFG
jgi:hypothetical protein